LSKREYLIRNYFISKGYKSTLPEYFTASPKNPLLIELKDLTPFIDPVSLSLESSRNLHYYHSSIFNTSLLHSLFSNINYNLGGLPLNTNFITNYLLAYLVGNSDIYNTSSTSNELLRNQYRPMRKGVSNMIKLHATGAVAMPIETRLHILASSKDVIHS
jgi:hypothetical protein